MTVLIILAEWVALSILFAAGFSLAVGVMAKWAAIADEMELDLTGPPAAPFSRCSREPASSLPASGRSDSPPQGSPGPVGDPT